MTKKAGSGSGSGSVPKCHGSTTLVVRKRTPNYYLALIVYQLTEAGGWLCHCVCVTGGATVVPSIRLCTQSPVLILHKQVINYASKYKDYLPYAHVFSLWSVPIGTNRLRYLRMLVILTKYNASRLVFAERRKQATIKNNGKFLPGLIPLRAISLFASFPVN